MHITLGEKCYECYMAQETADFFRTLHDLTNHINSKPLFGFLIKYGVMIIYPHVRITSGKSKADTDETERDSEKMPHSEKKKFR